MVVIRLRSMPFDTSQSATAAARRSDSAGLSASQPTSSVWPSTVIFFDDDVSSTSARIASSAGPASGLRSDWPVSNSTSAGAT